MKSMPLWRARVARSSRESSPPRRYLEDYWRFLTRLGLTNYKMKKKVHWRGVCSQLAVRWQNVWLEMPNQKISPKEAFFWLWFSKVLKLKENLYQTDRWPSWQLNASAATTSKQLKKTGKVELIYSQRGSRWSAMAHACHDMHVFGN